MKFSRSLANLSLLVAVLVLIYTVPGLFLQNGGPAAEFTTLRGQNVEIYGRGIYRFDTTFFAAGFRGTDLVTVFLAVPILIFSIYLYRKGSLRGGFLLIGSLVYMLYNSFSLGVGASYNPLFLIYIMAFSAGLFALGIAWTQLDFSKLPLRIQPGMPDRFAAIYLFIGGSATALLWLSDMLPPLVQSGSPPPLMGPYTTVITYFIDLGLITPACILAGVWLLRGNPRGYVLGFSLLYLLALMGFIVISQTVFQLNAGIVFSPPQLIGMIGSWIVLGAIAVRLVLSILRNISAENPVQK